MHEEIVQLRNVTYDRFHLIRAIIRLLTSEKFEEAYKKASPKQKQQILIYTYNNDKNSIARWIKDILKERNIFELQDEARILGIKNFRKLPKYMLIDEIRRVKNI